MKSFCATSLSLALLLAYSGARAQGAQWVNDRPGRLIRVESEKAPALDPHRIFKVFNQLPMFQGPRGHNIHQWYTTSKEATPYQAKLLINFYSYYQFEGGPVKLSNSHPTTIGIVINQPRQMMNEQSILFGEESESLGLPQIFTDTFTLTCTEMDGVTVGYGIYTEFNRKTRIYVLNGRQLRLFRPATRAEYYRVFLAWLDGEIRELTQNLEETRVNIAEMERLEAMKAAIPEIKQAYAATRKWTDFLSSRKSYYAQRLASMSAAEKAAPAYYHFFTDNAAVMADRNGKYVDTIWGNLPYQPLEGEGQGIPLFTFQEKPFDPRLPKTAIQHMAIFDPFREDDQDPLKHYLDKELYPRLSFRQLAALMYK